MGGPRIPELESCFYCCTLRTGSLIIASASMVRPTVVYVQAKITGSSLSNVITCRFYPVCVCVCVCVCGLPAETGIVLQMGTISVYARILLGYRTPVQT